MSAREPIETRVETEGDDGQTLALKLWIVLARAHNAIEAHAADDVARHGLTLAEFGVPHEVRVLSERPAGLSRTASKALGYHELLEHVAGRCALPDAVELIALRTRQFARRQRAWFRRDPRIEWVAPEDAPGRLFARPCD